MNLMFGVPYYHSNIDSTMYNKSEILSDITENYNKSSFRNEWDSSSILHHSYNDKDNPNFKQIDYSSLIPLYTKHIENFLNGYSDIPVKFRYDVENYTCMTKGQFMNEHDHPYTDFSAVHYLKFNPNEHISTTYVNPAHWIPYTDRIVSRKMTEIHKTNNLMKSWFWPRFHLSINEDDFVITPAPLKHLVDLQTSEELRIVIVLNIHILDN